MEFKKKLSIYILIGMVFMLIPLYLSIQSINSTSKIIDFMVNEQMQISKLSYKLDNDIKINDSDVLTAIILKDESAKVNAQDPFNSIKDDVQKIDDFLKNIEIKSDKLADKLNVIKRRLVGYEAVNRSIYYALNKKK